MRYFEEIDRTAIKKLYKGILKVWGILFIVLILIGIFLLDNFTIAIQEASRVAIFTGTIMCLLAPFVYFLSRWLVDKIHQ